MHKQLLKNVVRVQFLNPLRVPQSEHLFDLCIDAERRQMGKLCGEWQSVAVGNRIVSTVIEIVRAD